MIATRLMRALDLQVPLVQAPMAGGPSTPALAAAVSEAGGLGSLGCGYLEPDGIRDEIRATRRRTDRPFAVSLFAPHTGGPVDAAALEAAEARLERYRLELGLPARPSPLHLDPVPFDDQLQVVGEERPAVVSFTFGTIPRDAVTALHDAGCLLVGTATTVAEALVLVGDGFDVVCAQGSEAGGHRGTFLADPERALVGTIALVPRVVDAVDVPVIAAGGIMDARGIVAALALGADAAQLGTAFLRCPEAGTNDAHRAALATADETSTVVTSALTGRAVRGLANRLTEELAGTATPGYPAMHALTSELRRTAAAAGRFDLTGSWAGQGAGRGSDRPAGELVRELAEGTERLLADLGRSPG